MNMNGEKPIHVLVVDDHQIVITGIRVLLKESLPRIIIDGLLSTESLAEKLSEKDYALIILDINMPGMDTHNLIHIIKQKHENTRILIFSMNAEEIFAKRYFRLGANGYLMKDAGEQELVQAIAKIIKTGRYVSPKLMEILSEDFFTGKTRDTFEELTPREFEVMKYLIKGLGAKEIAAITHLHNSTISAHKTRIFEKTGTRNILELKQMATLHKLI